ncbi:MAG: M3 family oligoendopeptidase [Lachnospiraceae bacterium]|nr:M3 family oligoendopeptidase [Lachnospiraceae bacterium]
MENWKFSEIRYVRPNAEEVTAKLRGFRDSIAGAKDGQEVVDCILAMEKELAPFNDMISYAYIQNTLNTQDEFYEKEVAWIDEAMPVMQPEFLAVSAAVEASPFRPYVEEKLGHQYFVQSELQKKSFCEANIPLMQREAELTTEYQKLMAGCAIEFQGQTLNLYGIQKYFEHEDRAVRREAVRLYSEFYAGLEGRLEEIWDELIHLRDQMGKNLGFENFIPLGYLRQGRTDYGVEDVASFREQVRRELVPLCQELYEAQAKRLGLDAVSFCDEKRVFPDGNATPAGDDDFMIEQARRMYHAMSPETAEFIDFMIGHELMDLKNKPGKASTGYCTALPGLEAPYVFSCFNQTIFDMQVLTHELGHAFAFYRAMRHQPLQDYANTTTDIAEIHSMSMEQFAYPYAEQFFGDDADKFRFAHLQEAITFVPFGVAVDEYQHICYANPDLTPKERTLEWKKLEEKYMPWRRYDGDEFFGRGGWWYHKLHIFLYPFYYINYTLTTMGAMEFRKKHLEDPENAWKDYLTLCDVGSSKSYLETLAAAHLTSPFTEGMVARVIAPVKKTLEEQMQK